MHKHGITPSTLERVDIHLPSVAFALKLDARETPCEEDCGFSLPHLIAMMALGIPPGGDWISAENRTNAAVAAIKARVNCHFWPEADGVVQQQALTNRVREFPFRLEVRASAVHYTAEGLFAPSDPFTPQTRFSDQDVIRKFRTFTASRLDREQTDRCIKLVMELEDQPDVSALVAAMARNP